MAISCFATGNRTPGVIPFRLGYLSIEDRNSSLRRVLDDHAEHLDHFIVVSPHGSRIASARTIRSGEFAS